MRRSVTLVASCLSLAVVEVSTARNWHGGNGHGVSNFFANLPKVSGVDGDAITNLERLKGHYHIPDSDENFKQVLDSLRSPKPTSLSSEYPSMIVPMKDGKSTSWKPVGAGDNWMQNLYGHSAPDSVGDVFYDVHSCRKFKF